MIDSLMFPRWMEPPRPDGMRSNALNHREDRSAASTENDIFSAVDVAGIETLDDHGRPYQSFILIRIAAPHLHDARYYREQPTTAPILNTRI